MFKLIVTSLSRYTKTTPEILIYLTEEKGVVIAYFSVNAMS